MCTGRRKENTGRGKTVRQKETFRNRQYVTSLRYADEESSLTNRHCLSPDGRKKIEDMYHPITERSEFYTMADVHKPPVLFTPSEELEKVSSSCL